MQTKGKQKLFQKYKKSVVSEGSNYNITSINSYTSEECVRPIKRKPRKKRTKNISVRKTRFCTSRLITNRKPRY